MSQPSLPKIPAAPPIQDVEKLPTKAIVFVLAAALTVFGIGLWLANKERVGGIDRLHGEFGEAEHPPSVGRPEIGIVDQELFETEVRSQTYKLEASKKLHTYGWVDRPAGIIHIPVEKAMEMVLAEQRQ
jgi:hypothetical protein